MTLTLEVSFLLLLPSRQIQEACVSLGRTLPSQIYPGLPCPFLMSGLPYPCHLPLVPLARSALGIPNAGHYSLMLVFLFQPSPLLDSCFLEHQQDHALPIHSHSALQMLLHEIYSPSKATVMGFGLSSLKLTSAVPDAGCHLDTQP